MMRRPSLRIVGTLALLGCIAAGCNVIGVLAGKMLPEPKVPAKFVPDKLAPLLVICENFRDEAMSESDANRVGRAVSDELDQQKVAPIIALDKLSVVRDAHPNDFSKMSVIDLAKAVGARQVIYVDLGAIGIGSQPGSEVLKGVASARVKVIDVDTGNVLFPAESNDGVSVGFESPMRRATDRVSPDTIRAETLAGLATRVARLFYDWEPNSNEIDTGV